MTTFELAMAIVMMVSCHTRGYSADVVAGGTRCFKMESGIIHVAAWPEDGFSSCDVSFSGDFEEGTYHKRSFGDVGGSEFFSILQFDPASDHETQICIRGKAMVLIDERKP